MKRNFKLFVAVAVLVAMVLTLASCDALQGLMDKINPPTPTPHEHTFSDSWSNDETNHWHSATCTDGEDCASQKSDVAPHTFADGACSVCGKADPDFVPECAEHQYSVETTKEPTCTEDGEKQFTCTVCGHSTTQTVTALGHDEKKIEGKDPTCTEDGLTDGKECTVCGTVTKAQKTINANGHSFVAGECTVCGELDPEYTGPRTYVLDVQDFAGEGFSAGKKADGATEVVANFFTVHYSAKTKIDSTKDKVWEDGYTVNPGFRLNFGGTTEVNSSKKDDDGNVIGTLTKNAIEFDLTGIATIKVWWVAGGYGREVAIFDEAGEIVAVSYSECDPWTTTESNDGSEVSGSNAAKNALYLSEFKINKPGKYFIGTDNSIAAKKGGNIFFKVEVVETPAPKPSTFEGEGTTDVPYTIPALGDYVSTFPGGYDLVWHQYTATANGFLTLSSTMGEGAWLKLGANAYVAKSNDGNGEPVTTYVVAGNTYFVGVADWSEVEGLVPFTLSFEAFESDPVDPVVGNWKGTANSMWAGETTYIANINADGLGTYIEKASYFTAEYDITLVLVDGNDIIIFAEDEFGNIVESAFTFDAEAPALVGEDVTLTPYTPSDDDGPTEGANKPLSIYNPDTTLGGNNEVPGETVIYEYTADGECTLRIEFGNAIMAEVIFTYSINGDDAISAELGSTVDLELYAGDKLVITATTDGGWSSIGASFAGDLENNPGEDVGGGDVGGDDGDEEDPIGSFTNPIVIDSLPYTGVANIATMYSTVYYTFTAPATGGVTISVTSGTTDCLTINEKSVTTLEFAVIAGNEYTICFYNDDINAHDFTVAFEERELTADDYKAMLNTKSGYTEGSSWSAYFNYDEYEFMCYYVNIADDLYTNDHTYTYDITANADGSFTITNLQLIEGAYAAGSDEMTGKTLTLTPNADGGYLLTIE